MASTSPTMTKPKKRSSNRKIDYRCSACGQETRRDLITVKRVEFATIGANWKRLKSRTVAWLCPGCRDADPAWTQDSLIAAPGLADARKAREDGA